MKDNSVNQKFAFILEKEGKASEFSRVKRTFIARVQVIKITVPSLSEQQKKVSAIEKIKQKINFLLEGIALISTQKEAILKKYL